MAKQKKEQPFEFKIDGMLIEPTEEAPPYGGEIKGQSLHITFADDWNSFELYACRYTHQTGYTIFGQFINMNGSENIGLERVSQFCQAVQDYASALTERRIHIPGRDTKKGVLLLKAIKRALCPGVCSS